MNAGTPLKLVSAKFRIRTLSGAILPSAVLAGCNAGAGGPSGSAAQTAGTIHGTGATRKPGTAHQLTAVAPSLASGCRHRRR